MDDKISDIKVGDILEYNGYQALEELGGTLQAEIISIARYALNGLVFHMLEFEYEGDTMALVCKSYEGDDQYFIYREFECNSFEGILEDTVAIEDHESNEELPPRFQINIDDVLTYEACEPFPLYQFESDDEHFGIGEYTLEDEHNETYWAIYSLWTWVITETEEHDDTENPATLWFGWPVNVSEIKFIN